MLVLLAVIGGMIFGTSGLALAIVVGVVVVSLGSRVPVGWILRLHRARPLAAPDLRAMVRELARRAGLRTAPPLFYVPSRALNAFAVGRGDEVAVGLTDGLLRSLDRRQLAGVLAHEISHVRNHDLWVMGLADMVSQAIRTFALIGQVILLVMLLGGYPIPWLAFLLLIAAPLFSALLQLALARTREFNADLDAVRLTGDPDGLASALARLEQSAGGWLRRLLVPSYQPADGSLLRTHPATAERIRRLRELAPAPPRRRPVRLLDPWDQLLPGRGFAVPRPPVVPAPRWYFG